MIDVGFNCSSQFQSFTCSFLFRVLDSFHQHSIKFLKSPFILLVQSSDFWRFWFLKSPFLLLNQSLIPPNTQSKFWFMISELLDYIQLMAFFWLLFLISRLFNVYIAFWCKIVVCFWFLGCLYNFLISRLFIDALTMLGVYIGFCQIASDFSAQFFAFRFLNRLIVFTAFWAKSVNCNYAKVTFWVLDVSRLFTV